MTELPVHFGPVTVTKDTASISWKLIDDAEVIGSIRLSGNADESPQLFDEMDGAQPGPHLDASYVLSGRLSVQLSDYGTPAEAIDELVDMAKRRGTICLKHVAKPIRGCEIDDEAFDEPEHPDVAAGRDRPHGQPVLEAAAEAADVQTVGGLLFSLGIPETQHAEILDVAEIDTDALIADFWLAVADWWPDFVDQLTQSSRVSAKTVSRLADARPTTGAGA